ncbi:polysaccharide biosynthesis/export family protein [Novosphingopyxis iocasae]|uniref:polysaccharide biosynthesis/export family protein n=1 Tax=Novosphingopyxis iocasae TaxID=2762729 RepID=UPI0016515B7E|nr:polysaccharide biosynthesis/export family protein [Novosphingopyxis iocasae]
MRAMTNEVRQMPVRRLMAGLLATSALASCAPQLQYDVPASIAVDPGTRDVARQANAMLETYYASRGDFSPNDVVRLTFPYFPVLNTDQRVQLSGFLTPPLLDPVQTRGVSVGELQARLEKLYQPKLEKPVVSVSVVEYANPPPLPQIFVMGEVTNPGAFAYRDGVTMLEGLARSGGPNQRADLSQVVVLTPNGDRVDARLVNLQAILDGAPGSIGYLAPYSIVIVPSSRLARTADKAETIRNIIGLNGITIAPRFSFLQ